MSDDIKKEAQRQRAIEKEKQRQQIKEHPILAIITIIFSIAAAILLLLFC